MAVAGAASRELLVGWCTQQLQKTFGLDVSEEILQYVLSIESAEEIREYVTDLLQGNEGKKGQFIEELITKWQKNDQELVSDVLQQSLKKDEILDGQRSGDQLKRSRRKGRNRQEVPAFAEPDTTVEVKTPFDLAKAQENSNSLKKKTKFVSLYTKEGQDRLAVLIPGRHPCDCLGQKHKLINNCLICGRIVCEQEGSGPCLFCGTLVCTHEERDILQCDSNKSQKLLKKLMSGTENSGKVDISPKDLLPHQELRMKSGLEKAIKHKDKLLEFDRTSIRRTQVIDDESDYFASDSNQWLSKIERETLQKREEELREFRHASRLSKKIIIDFAGRKIMEDENPLAEYHSKLDETIQAIANGTLNQPLTKLDRSSEEPLGVLVNPNLYQSPPQGGGEKLVHPSQRTTLDSSHSQKTFPSRSLRTPDYISSSSWESLFLEAVTTKLQSDPMWNFPNDYPSGCLLGCVDLTDCLSQKQFKDQGGGEKLVHPSQRTTLDSSHSQKTFPSRSLRTPDYISSSSWESLFLEAVTTKLQSDPMWNFPTTIRQVVFWAVWT
uniref:Thyroid hormone receptor interactor 4 n=1 Tax=Equus asinus TaxID=9793 RepID=A0A9L0K4Z9_EQUAS